MNSHLPKKLPVFTPVTDADLRRCWLTCPPVDTRRLILEVVRYQHLLAEIDRLYEAVQRAWLRETNSHLVALNDFKRLMSRERNRVMFKPTIYLDPPFEPNRNRLR